MVLQNCIFFSLNETNLLLAMSLVEIFPKRDGSSRFWKAKLMEIYLICDEFALQMALQEAYKMF